MKSLGTNDPGNSVSGQGYSCIAFLHSLNYCPNHFRLCKIHDAHVGRHPSVQEDYGH